MLVSLSNFNACLEELQAASELAVDTETKGLRAFHGDRLFSIVIAKGQDTGPKGFYFNFLPYPGLDPQWVLGPSHLDALRPLFADPARKWYLQNAKYDMHILMNEGIEIVGEIHCTRAIGLVEYNEHQDYDLGSALDRIGLKKDDTVDKYIEQHKLWTIANPYGNKEVKNKHFDRVPFEIISPYGTADATGTLALGHHQIASIRRQDGDKFGQVRSLSSVLANERRLTKTVWRMERVGVRIDKEYTLRAARYEADRAAKAAKEFKALTATDYKASPKLFAQLFVDEKERWEYTPKGNPSFNSDALKNFLSPVAKLVLVLRDAKSKEDFYNGFLYHMDQNGDVHPTFNPDGAGHGRFSSSEPNFQNLTSEDICDCLSCHKAFEDLVIECPDCKSTQIQLREYLVRKAVIPRPGFVFIMPDYDQMEYRFMLENACLIRGEETELVRKVLSGLDVHAATSQVATAIGVPISRGEAKTSNFLTLYGGGDGKLARGLKCPVGKAKAIRGAIFQAAPEIRQYLNLVMRTAEQRGYIINWLGRRCHFPNRSYAYRAPNYHIAGGCADINKVALNRIDEAFLGMKSRLVLTVHDENPCEIHESELQTAPRLVKEFMESVYQSKYLPLTTGMEFSTKSLGHKVKGFPV